VQAGTLKVNEFHFSQLTVFGTDSGLRIRIYVFGFKHLDFKRIDINGEFIFRVRFFRTGFAVNASI